MKLYNTVHYGIKKDQISFIYILIKRSKNNIWMALYHKPAETRRIYSTAENNAKKFKNLEN